MAKAVLLSRCTGDTLTSGKRHQDIGRSQGREEPSSRRRRAASRMHAVIRGRRPEDSRCRSRQRAGQMVNGVGSKSASACGDQSRSGRRHRARERRGPGAQTRRAPPAPRVRPARRIRLRLGPARSPAEQNRSSPLREPVRAGAALPRRPGLHVPDDAARHLHDTMIKSAPTSAMTKWRSPPAIRRVMILWARTSRVVACPHVFAVRMEKNFAARLFSIPTRKPRAADRCPLRPQIITSPGLQVGDLHFVIG